MKPRVLGLIIIAVASLCGAKKDVQCETADWNEESSSFEYQNVDVPPYEPGYYETRSDSWDIIPRHPAHYLPWNDQATGPLSPEQMQHFREQGYVILRNAVPVEDLAALNQEMQDLKASTTNEHTILEPGTTQIRSIFSPHTLKNSSVANLLSSRILAGPASQLLDSPVYIHQSRINFQAAEIGTGFQWHSDFETWHSEDGMPLPRSVSGVVMLTKNRGYNGALMVIPGSHKYYVRCAGLQPDANWIKSLKDPQKYGVPTQEQVRFLCKEKDIIHLTGDPGDVFLFDNNLMHGSHTNISPFSRINIFSVFNSVENKLQAPLYGKAPRPEHIGHRDYVKTL